MKWILTLAFSILLGAPLSAGVEVLDDAAGLKKIVVDHRMPADGFFVRTADSISISLEKDGKLLLVVPVHKIATAGQMNQLSAVAWVSEDFLPGLRINISGSIASVNSCGVYSVEYRYLPEMKTFVETRAKPAAKKAGKIRE